jgi:hypothetical protein
VKEVVAFQHDYDKNLLFNRVSKENENWVVDGKKTRYASDTYVHAFCANGKVTIQLLGPGNKGKYEMLQFTPSPSTGTITEQRLQPMAHALDDESAGLLLKQQTMLTYFPSKSEMPDATVTLWHPGATHTVFGQ